jgi:hypothetical protein
MSLKKVLFIDDGNVDEIIKKLNKNLKRQGFTLSENIINLELQEFKKKSEENDNKLILDFSKIKKYINENYINESFDLIACDYHYANDPLDGYSILKWIKNESRSKKHRIRRAKFVLYSSEGDKFAKKTNSVDDISKLIRIRFDDFLKRENLATDLTKLLLTQNSNFDFLNAIIKELDKYPDFKFKSVYPKFKGKTLVEIAQEIDKDLPNGIDFQKNLAELTIAHLIELNNIDD